jgi:hypothetical protein
MKQTVYLSDFRDAFQRMDRGNQFSYEALELIYDYLEECDDDMELDVIAICCDFDEMHYSDIIGQYETDITDELSEDADEDEQIEYIRNWLSDNTSLVGESTSGTFVFQSF